MEAAINQNILSDRLLDQITKAEQDKNLNIKFINNISALANAGKNGLFKMYKDIFAEAPYFEKFTIGEVKDYFTEMLEEGGFIFTASTPQKNKGDLMTAFVASIPLREKPAVAEIVNPYFEPQQSSYFAEDAVIPERRRQGISREMKKILLNANKEAGYKTFVLRTSKESFNQAAAVKQLGGQQIEGLEQEVDSVRLDGSTQPDTRVFFTFDLTKNNF